MFVFFRGAVGDKFVFMDDNATCHRTLAVQDCLEQRGPVAGRNYPPTNKNTLIRALTEEWDKLPQQLLDNVMQIYDHLKGLGLSSKFNVWVPQVLTERNLCRRIDVCNSLLKRHENNPFLKRIITGDGKSYGAKKMNRFKPFPKPIFTKKRNHGDEFVAGMQGVRTLEPIKSSRTKELIHVKSVEAQCLPGAVVFGESVPAQVSTVSLDRDSKLRVSTPIALELL
ncbi:histone-lysine N-methyltransferase SETMAR [Trichonephila clavipes]|nr:histone-lysine N-methyltransferase SETMAR [Trichonephila clavipes]